MAEKVPYLVEEIGGGKFIVLAESGSHAKTAVRRELIAKKASAMDVINAQRNGSVILDADDEITRKEAAKLAIGNVLEPEPALDGAPVAGDDQTA